VHFAGQRQRDAVLQGVALNLEAWTIQVIIETP